MRATTVSGEDYTNLIKLLSSLCDNNSNKIMDKHIQIKIGRGLAVGYSINKAAVAKYRIKTSDIGDIWSIIITPPKVYPKPKDIVTIKLLDNGYATIEYGNILFKYDQNIAKEKEIDYEKIYDQLADPYREIAKLNYVEQNNKNDSQKNYIGSVSLNPAYLSKIVSAIKSVEKVRVNLEVEARPNRAIRLSTRNMSIFLLPMRSSDDIKYWDA